MGSQRVGHDSATEQQQYYINHYITITDWLFGEKPPPYPVGTLLGIRETHGYQMKWWKGVPTFILGDWKHMQCPPGTVGRDSTIMAVFTWPRWFSLVFIFALTQQFSARGSKQTNILLSLVTTIEDSSSQTIYFKNGRWKGNTSNSATLSYLWMCFPR